MALKRRLASGWYLSDGILNPFPVGERADVLSAVVESGHAPDPLIGLNLMKCEWIYSRQWTYTAFFDAPTEGDERVSLLLEELRGEGELTVNGQSAGRFVSGEARFDVTGLIREGENELSLCFDSFPHALPGGDPMPRHGLTGPVWLKCGSYVTLQKLKSRVSGGEIVVDCDILAHTAGKYLFKYTVSLDGELVSRMEFPEKLPAARALRTHALRVEKPVIFAADRYDETVYDVHLSIERNGIGCEDVHFEEAFLGDCARASRTLVLRGGRLTAEEARNMRLLGAGAVCFEKPLGGRHWEGDFQFGLKLADACVPFCASAAIAPQSMLRETGDAAFWPPVTPLWRLRGGARPDLDGMEKKYGAGVRGDYDRAIRLSRYEQAVRMMAYASECRRAGKPAAFHWDMPWEGLCGDSLIERDGARRPAWYALHLAWRPHYVCAILPEEGATDERLMSIPICAMTDSASDGVVNVGAYVYRMDGSLLVSGSYPMLLGTARQAGTLSLNVPSGAQVLIVRNEMTGADGALLCRTDQLLCVRGDAPCAALLAPERARLRREDGRMRNDGDCAALSAGIALLPGEEIAWPLEWLNA